MNMMSIIDKIYENKNFSTIFIVAILALALLFIIILIIGLKDAKKSKMPKKETKEEDVKDISFSLPSKEQQEDIKEDVTFELPVLTDDLENFKKNLEEEIKKDESVEIERKANFKKLDSNTSPIKILDVQEIEDTAIIETIDEEKIAKEEKKISRVEKKVKTVAKGNVKESKYNSKDNF